MKSSIEQTMAHGVKVMSNHYSDNCDLSIKGKELPMHNLTQQS